jgi:Zn-dependent protease with chaperone function
MRPALVVGGYAVVVAWCLPALLSRLTERGVSVRLGLAAWLAAMVSAGASAVIALQFLIRSAVAGWPRFSEAVCRSVTGGACTPVVYRSALFELSVAATAALATLAAAVAVWRYGRRTQRAHRQSQAHAETARITGRSLPGTGAVVLDDPRPAAYCVAGRPAVIVLTSGALAVLDPAQLSAVLAHERAHLAGRHHALVTLIKGLAAAFPGVPLFGRGLVEVTRLSEMSADDAAARASGRTTLVAALLAIGTGTAVTGAVLGAGTRGALAAAAYAVPARVERMLRRPSRRRHAAFGGALAGVLALLIVLPSALTVITAR